MKQYFKICNQKNEFGIYQITYDIRKLLNVIMYMGASAIDSQRNPKNWMEQRTNQYQSVNVNWLMWCC